MNRHTLIFHLQGLDQLQTVMGAEVMRSVMRDLHAGIEAIFIAVLQQSAIQTSRFWPKGYWTAEFVSPPEQAWPGTQGQLLEAMPAAATQMGSALAREVFGSATAAVAGLRVALLQGSIHPQNLDMRVIEAFATVPVPEAGENELEQAIREHRLRTFLQPIVSFADGRVLGYEALTRGPAGSTLERADQLFGAAAQYGLSHALELACLRQALAWADRLPSAQWLTVNLSSGALLDASIRQMLARPGIVVEITEHLPLVSAAELLPAIAELRAAGVLLALDDTGCGYADLQAAETLRPDMVKLCITVVRSLGRDPRILDALQDTISKLRDLDIRVLAEGVETEREAQILRGFAIDYAQGWLYGKPQPAGAWLPA